MTTRRARVLRSYSLTLASKGKFHARVWPKLVARASTMFRDGDRVLVAVSGGPDSVCLADFLARWGPRRRLTLRIAHFDHGLRRGSARDAAFVRDLARRLGVGVSVETLAVKARARAERRGLEDAGRALRYRALARLARRYRCGKVAVGHQLDDQAETVLLHALRGTRAEGLAGMPERRALGSRVELVRPLLSVSRAEVLEYLRYRRLSRREDPTNRSTKFLRNWVRLRLLPLMERRAPGTARRLAAMAGALREALPPPSTRAGAGPGRARSTRRPRPARRRA